MIPFAAIKYLISSAILVVSIFLGLRLLFANDIRREEWRSKIKRRIYMSRERFKRVTVLLGLLLLALGAWMTALQVVGLLENR